MSVSPSHQRLIRMRKKHMKRGVIEEAPKVVKEVMAPEIDLYGDVAKVFSKTVDGLAQKVPDAVLEILTGGVVEQKIFGLDEVLYSQDFYTARASAKTLKKRAEALATGQQGSGSSTTTRLPSEGGFDKVSIWAINDHPVTLQ